MLVSTRRVTHSPTLGKIQHPPCDIYAEMSILTDKPIDVGWEEFFAGLDIFGFDFMFM